MKNKAFNLSISIFCFISAHLSAQKDLIIIKDTAQVLIDSTKIINIDNSGPLFAENRNSTRSNSDKCCPDLFYVDKGNGTTKKFKLNLFEKENVKGPIEVFAYNTKGKALDLSKAINFSKDDSSVHLNLKYCSIGMDTNDQPIKIDPKTSEILLEFRVSAGKKNFITLSKLNSWPPDISKPRSKILSN